MTEPIPSTGPTGQTPPDAPATSRQRRRWPRVIAAVLGGIVVAVVAFAAFLLLKPVTLPTETAAPQPTATYEEAMARFAEVQAREAGQDLIPVCQSRILGSGEREARSVVLLHGYTNCPQMFEQLGEELAAAGFNVYIPLAPEHGEVDREHSTLDHLTAEELIAYGNEAVDIATGLGEEVTVIGLSGGGSVAAYLAQFRDDVDLAVPIAPFIGLLAVPAPLTSALVNLADVLPPFAWGIPESVASGSGEYAPYAGLDNNTKSAAAYMRLGSMVLGDATDEAHGATRVVVVLNEGDDTVNNELTQEVLLRWEALAADATADHRFPASLGLPHDLIGPDRVDQRTSEVYPVLLEIVGAP